MKQREPVDLKESVEPRDHYQSHYSMSSLALLATDSLEAQLKLA